MSEQLSVTYEPSTLLLAEKGWRAIFKEKEDPKGYGEIPIVFWTSARKINTWRFENSLKVIRREVERVEVIGLINSDIGFDFPETFVNFVGYAEPNLDHDAIVRRFDIGK